MISEDQIRQYMMEGFSEESDRDRQVKIGPSELGGCAFCVGYTMARKWYELPKRGSEVFGYSAKLGTMLHEWMERHHPMPEGTLREQKLETVTVEGYGLVKGTADLIIPAWEATGDYKFPGKASYDEYALRKRMGKPPPNNHVYQGQLYAHGARKLGIPVSRHLVFVFPRHSNSLRDLLVFEMQYREELVEAVVRRAEAIVEDIHDGNLWAIESEDGCYSCERHGRPAEINDYRQLVKEEQTA